MNEAQVMSVWIFRRGDWLLRLNTSLSMHESIVQKLFCISSPHSFYIQMPEFENRHSTVLCSNQLYQPSSELQENAFLLQEQLWERSRIILLGLVRVHTGTSVLHSPSQASICASGDGTLTQSLECEFSLCEMPGSARHNEQLYSAEKRRRR